MKRGALSTLVGRLRDAVRPGGPDVPDDDELLRRWTRQRDEAAFELLVWRHGRLVLGVCQRLLRSPQDVEDAFQATFLLLVRKGANILRRQAVASWLYTVAYRVALEARSRRREAPLGDAVAELPGREGPPSVPELGDVLDEEVRRLPEKYRLPFVLCYLQGRTNEEAARELGRPVGTVLSRLSRARERLRQRLTRRGLGPAAVTAPLVPSLGALPDLVGSTTRAALSVAAAGATAAGVAPGVLVLMEGAMRTMFVMKLKTVAAAVMLAAVLGGSAVGFRLASAQSSGGATGASDDVPARTKELLELERKLQEELDLAQERAKALQAKITQVQDDLGKRRPPRAGNRGTGASSGGTTGTVARTRTDVEKDEIELLQARVNVKEAAVLSSQALLEESKRRLAAMQKARQRIPGSVSDDDFFAGKVTVDRYQAEVDMKKAELLEAQILLKQAQRRQSSRAATSSLEQRIRQLEDKVTTLEAALKRTPPGSPGGVPRR
ncbi:MAG: sigma-70 family RNA polymerase sigma factor [Gemmataceae bacterium]